MPTVAIALLVVLVAAVRPAHAQIVNVQGQLAKAPEKDGIAGQLEAKLDLRDGNDSLFVLSAGGAVMIRRGRLLTLAIARGEYGESRDLVLSQKTFEHLRARYTLDRRWRWEAFLQHEYDAFRRLSVRAVAGTGPAFQIIETKSGGLLAGAAYLVEFEQLDQRPGTIDAGLRSLNHRASLYLTGTERLGEGVSILGTVYLQPRLDELADVRVLGELSVTSKLSKRIALTDGLTIAYDRTPPDRVLRRDIQLKLGLLVTF